MERENRAARGVAQRWLNGGCTTVHPCSTMAPRWLHGGSLAVRKWVGGACKMGERRATAGRLTRKWRAEPTLAEYGPGRANGTQRALRKWTSA
eukprot:9011303-Lingulodinium_polyedra.AAC.1